MIKEFKGRNWSCISYLEDKDDILERLRDNKNIRDYAFILHDLDFNADGEVKPRHWHICLILKQTRDRKQVEKIFIGEGKDGKKINCLAEKTIDNKAIAEYLTHKNEPEKHQYPDTDIVSSDLKAFTDKQQTDDNTFCIIEDMLSNTPLRELCSRYGKDFIYHYGQYKMIVGDILKEEYIKEKQQENFFFNDFKQTNIDELPSIQKTKKED